MADKAWIGLEEAIAQVMKSKGCSRRTARRLIAAKVKDKSLPIRRVPVKNPFPKLDPAEALRRLDEGRDDDVLLTLADFMRYFQMTPDEALVELRAGRLLTCTTENMLMEIELGPVSVHPEQVMVTYAAIVDWLHNPDTPQHLILRRTGN